MQIEINLNNKLKPKNNGDINSLIKNNTLPVCYICGKEFIPEKSKRGKLSKFCGKKCRHSARYKKVYPVFCLSCGRVFYTYPFEETKNCKVCRDKKDLATHKNDIKPCKKCKSVYCSVTEDDNLQIFVYCHNYEKKGKSTTRFVCKKSEIGAELKAIKNWNEANG